MTSIQAPTRGRPDLGPADGDQGRTLFDDSSPIDNPLRAGQTGSRVPDPCVMVIFGVTGDLTARKLMPSLYDLAVGHPLPEGFAIVGVARRDWTDESFREEMRAAVVRGARTPVTDQAWKQFSEGLFYVQGDFATEQTYTDLSARLNAIDAERRTQGNRLFYLATSPNAFPDIVRNLGESGIAERREIYGDEGASWNRVVVEKPFGHDVESARTLIQEMASVFSEEQIYRIDHYLGKETVQNVMAFRFANILFEPIFSRSYVEQVQITAAEAIGVEGRGGYYDDSGALRDMVQSHLLQLLTVVAMEPPAVFDGDAVRDEKVKVLRAIVPPQGSTVETRTVRGQYGAGFAGGKPVDGYIGEKGVKEGSQTETFAALKLEIDNWRWADVPFYLRTGKRMPRRVTEIAITFKKVPHLMFRNLGDSAPDSNVITMRIQPDEGIALRFAAKVPGPSNRLRNVPMDFYYGSTFGEASPDAYERLLLDAMLGDPTLFQRRDEVETAWTLMQPILDGWAEGKSPTRTYESGTWGPAEADQMLRDDGYQWRRP
ncbi:MAG TPA: glucose-6-phosphate dehydrogenase [Thermomicrobiales bacterium]|jgi:glucose-6-phosphate 1-dehydrogenase|nr:glucose-6-phosphate dehydrogenase [Thermomicrobiales bacterium]